MLIELVIIPALVQLWADREDVGDGSHAEVLIGALELQIAIEDSFVWVSSHEEANFVKDTDEIA